MNRARNRSRARWFLVGVLAVCGSYAHAQAYPSKPIEFVAHTSPGSGTDLFGRNVSNLLEKEKDILPADHAFEPHRRARRGRVQLYQEHLRVPVQLRR